MTPIDQYIYSKEEQISEVLDFLNDQIMTFDQEINSTIKWRVPYYSKIKSLCYLNVVKSGHAELNFTQGYLFGDGPKQLIEFNGRTIVGGIKFNSLEEIDIENLMQVLEEAVRIDGLSNI